MRRGRYGRPHGPGRGAVASVTVLAGMLLAWSPCALALNPALDVSQYAHTAWKVREGFSKGLITAIVQTPDGYLWLGTEFGLLRFDGVRNVPWQPPSNQQLPSAYISRLLVARDGTLWIGTYKGLASWKGAKLTQYAELSGQFISALFEDGDGTVWAAGMRGPGARLCTIQKGGVQCSGEDGSFGQAVLGLYEDSKGNLWVGAVNGLWRWKPGPPKFYPMPGEPNGIESLAEDEDGSLLMVTYSGIKRLVDGKAEAYPLPGAVGKLRARNMFRDRAGSLWIGTTNQGLVHVHQGRAEVFAQSDSLSGDDVYRFFEDREGSIWVSTLNGLDRFRDFAIATLSGSQGLSNATIAAVLAGRDGTVWVGTFDGLKRWNQGQITAYRERSTHSTTATVREIVGSGLPGRGIESLFQDDRGRIWVATVDGVGYMENDRFTYVQGIPGGVVRAITQDTGGNLWIADLSHGLFHVSRENVVQQIPPANLGGKGQVNVLAADPLQRGIWLGFIQGGVSYFVDGRISASYSAADGLGEGSVDDFRIDRDGTLWVATEGGLSRLKNGRVATLNGKNGLPCDSVHWVMQDDAHSFWLYMPCGLARVARSDMDAWAAAVDKDKNAKQTVQAKIFDTSDGVRSRANGGGYTPHVSKSPDGKLWFSPTDGVSVVDPSHLPFNKLPPPVHVEQIVADRKTYDAASDANGRVRLPPLVRDLEIDYTALSLAAPEKVRFRYKLEGHDRDWQDAGTRRQAFYGNLSPRNYRFRVMACNNSGVWNEAGAFLDFSIAPAYYQTTWFRLSFVAAFLALLGVLYQLRLRQVARQFNMRIEERVSERTRIARDFHDTLLQSFQGVLMKFSAVKYLIRDRPAEAEETLETLLGQARQAITEGRDAVQGLRSSTVITNDLARAIAILGEQLAAEQTSANPPGFRVHVEGASRDLAPLLREEVYRIAGEALRNAFRHSHAQHIEVEIRYGQRHLRLGVRDDGKGIAPKVLSDGGRIGHHGLPGMYERAKLVGGKLAIRSELDSGTEAELTIPAAVAYAKSPVAQRSMSSGEGT
jgi:ligand-binding sensor domain-containing protein/signal transduction histidine kinase